jgi:probable phosphomutase (TIGR03848 family)
MTRFLLIRHATTDANGKRLAGRRAGMHLDEHGRRQSQVLAERLARLPVAAIYSSPLERTVETAEPIAKLLGREVVTREELLEIEFGDWTDKGFGELDPLPEFRRFNEFRSCARVPGGEFMLQAQLRMVLGLDALRRLHPDECVAVVSHGDMIRAAIAYYAGIPLDLFQRLEVSPASISTIDIDDSAVRLVSINDTHGMSG